MARTPKPMKPFHLYDLIPYRTAKVLGTDTEPIPYTTYGKTVKDAMKTFVDNHVGSFVLVSDEGEKEVTICEGGIWYEEGSCIRCNSGRPVLRTV